METPLVNLLSDIRSYAPFWPLQLRTIAFSTLFNIEQPMPAAIAQDNDLSEF
jgi:hypothetical protein